MKNKIVVAATALFLGFASIANAQPAPGPDGPRPPKPGLEKEALQQVTTFTGQAGAWVANDDYVYDGFYLQTSSEKLLVKFPAHLGSQLKAAIQNGSNISVNGVSKLSPEGDKEIRFVSITAAGKTITDTPPATPVAETTPTVISDKGKITQAQTNKKGDVHGFVLDNKTILRIPPHAAAELSKLAPGGTVVSYTGIAKKARTGEVASENYNIIHCQSITINGTQYLTR